MADYLATNVFAGTGSIMQVEIDFAGYQNDLPGNPAPYLNVEDVKAKIVQPATATSERVETPVGLTQVNALTFQTQANIPADAELWVYRETQDLYALVDFKNLQSVSERDLDLAIRQVLYMAQETKDTAETSYLLALEAQEFARDLGGIALEELAEVKAQAELALSIAQATANQLSTITNGPFSPPYNAKGDGITDDTAAFTAFEANVRGQIVNLGNKRVRVTAEPTGNTYVNGVFVINGFNKPAIPLNSAVSVMPKFHTFGGQLRDLKVRLCDTFCQFLSIVFIGDSITWGVGATGTSPGTGFPPSDHTLSDIRAMYGAPTFVNQFKRYIRDNYKKGDGFLEIVSNWPASPAGESTVLYQNIELMYPRYGRFDVQTIGASQAAVDLQTNNSPSGFILSLNNTVAGAQYGHSVSFPLTGTKFIMGLRCSGGGATDAFVDILVNGTPVITNLSVQPGNNGLVDDVFNYDQQIEIVVPYVVDGTVTIRTNRNGLAGQRLLSLTSIRIPRQVRIVNQGLSGTTTVSYLANCLDGNTSGDGVAITGTDMFVFVQLGTNDRGWSTGRPRGSNDFEVKYNALLDNAAFTGKKVILMAANPAGNEDPTDFPFHMQEVRNIIYRVARLRQFDMIDNYSVFAGMHNLMYTTDQLHPNDYGHSIIARNMINSLESA